MTDADVASRFRNRFGRDPRLFRAPGRVNLIGEHTDYNDGFVLPTAIELGTTVAAASRADRVVRVASAFEQETASFDLDGPTVSTPESWLAYVEGVARVLESLGTRLFGADLLVESTVPIGAGLSSSAALEIATALALTRLSGVEVDRRELARAGQRAEHEFAGTQCGIMDQTVVALGRAGHALLLDCRSLETREVPVDLAHAAIVICDSRVKHSLASSTYNERRRECTEGVALLARHRPEIAALRDVGVAEFEALAEQLPDTIRRRCRHVVTENARTLEAADALAHGDLPRFGALMAASHASLRDDYEVSCAELDALVEAALDADGVFGARMTGGGFGGCTVNLVARDRVDAVRDHIAERYTARTGLTPRIFVTRAADGAAETTAPQKTD